MSNQNVIFLKKQVFNIKLCLTPKMSVLPLKSAARVCIHKQIDEFSSLCTSINDCRSCSSWIREEWHWLPSAPAPFLVLVTIAGLENRNQFKRNQNRCTYSSNPDWLIICFYPLVYLLDFKFGLIEKKAAVTVSVL